MLEPPRQLVLDSGVASEGLGRTASGEAAAAYGRRLAEQVVAARNTAAIAVQADVEIEMVWILAGAKRGTDVREEKVKE